jgi:hypothetical protein
MFFKKGRSRFLRNVGKFPPDHTAQQSRRQWYTKPLPPEPRTPTMGCSIYVQFAHCTTQAYFVLSHIASVQEGSQAWRKSKQLSELKKQLSFLEVAVLPIRRCESGLFSRQFAVQVRQLLRQEWLACNQHIWFRRNLTLYRSVAWAVNVRDYWPSTGDRKRVLLTVDW